MKPLVSIVIPAYNAEATIAETLKSAIGQSWRRKEILVVDDGSTDRTAAIARSFQSAQLKVVSTENRGLSAAVNVALCLSQGDYIQELDSDDILVVDKIERQLSALRPDDSSKKILLSSPWAPFFHRTRGVRFVQNSLCQSLSPVEWLLRKMGENLHMQNATWLVSRELVEAAGPWDTRLEYDQDGEYFARVILASEGIRFVPGTGIYYRASGAGSISNLGSSEKKRESLLLSMKLHIQYLQFLEQSERVQKVSLQYLQNWYAAFYPSRPDLVAELHAMASHLGGELKAPKLGWKYAWLKPVFGDSTAAWAQYTFPQLKTSLLRYYDKAMYRLDTRECS
jgi:glycosyltransferase involved in cell wall biosynthesis